MKLLLIRHGMTAGNREKRYIGRTDEPLCEEGVIQLQQRAAELERTLSGNPAERPAEILPENPSGNGVPSVVFVSPMQRCRQTAEILFPGIRQIVIPDLAEMDFGIFEGRAYQGDLEFSQEYSTWLESMCEDPIRGGESKEAFSARCRKGFEEALRTLSSSAGVAGEGPNSGEDMMNAGRMDQDANPDITAAFVVHGGTIMAILSGFAEDRKEYYEWHSANGRGYAGEWDGTMIRNMTEC